MHQQSNHFDSVVGAGQKLGHRRRPSIGKSMPVTALLLNFPPPSSKSYNSLSRDGMSPELDEKPPQFFHIDEELDYGPINSTTATDNTQHIMDKDNEITILDTSDNHDQDCDEDFVIIKGSDSNPPCPNCSNSSGLLQPLTPLNELCKKLCNNKCKSPIENEVQDVEDIEKMLCSKCDSCGQSDDLNKKYCKSPSKIDKQRHDFLNDMLNTDNITDLKNNCLNLKNYKNLQSEESDLIINTLTSEPTATPSSPSSSSFNIKDFREKFAIAEALAKTSMMTSPAAKRRLAARKIEMELDNNYDSATSSSTFNNQLGSFSSGTTVAGGSCEVDDKEFIPPRQLLLYLVRMGSFNSAPKINNTDTQDDTLVVPQGLTSNDLVQHCKIMRGENRPQLLTRYFLKPTVNNEIISNDIAEGLRVLKLSSVSKVCSAPMSSAKHLRILQWNILSQSLGQNNDGFICCPEEALTWENRKYLIVEEIMQNNPDIVCLQEVDHFKFIERLLGSQNYNGIFFPKPDSPCLYIQENNGPDGCAIFYKRDKFELLNFDTRVLEVWRVQSNQVAIAANFRVTDTGKEICICTTHLKARNGALLSKLRNEQGKDLLRFVNNIAQNRPVILSGDFNAEPIEPIYSTVLNYKTLGLSSAYADISESLEDTRNNDKFEQKSLDHIDRNVDTEIPTTVDYVAEKSANREPPYTTWKIREEGEVCHTIDYVFYSKKHLKVNNCLMFPQENEIGQNRTPSFQYPSDHFSLVCDFEILDDNDL